MRNFSQSKWIWQQAEAQPDEWVSFFDQLPYAGGRATVRVCADSAYALYLNGELALFGKYADYPDRRVYEEKEISALLKPGKNAFSLLVWYYGVSNSTYRRGEAGAIFEVTGEGGEVLLASGEQTLSRPAPDYRSHRCETITGQLGYNFFCDGTRYDGYREADFTAGGEYTPSRVLALPLPQEKRPIELLELKERCPAVPVMQGAFSLFDSERTAVRLHRAMQSFCPYGEMADQPASLFGKAPTRFRTESGDGLYVVLDMGREETGYLDLEIELPEEADLFVTYGEHLLDGRVRAAIDGRNFVVGYRGRKGINRFLSPFRRLGLRYLQIYVCCASAVVAYAGIRPTEYPVTPVPFDCKNLLRQTVYNVSLRTLHLSMHEHYEDCPWREQALYNMDSRNQMLFGYHGFREFRFARASLLLMTGGQRENGLLELCFPAEVSIVIPYFSLMYAVQVCEYIEYSGDQSLLGEAYPVVKRINAWFEGRIRSGLIVNDLDPAVWNFYEWRDELCGYGNARECDVLIQAFYSLSLQSAAKLANLCGETADAAACLKRVQDLNERIRRTFWNEQRQMFSTYPGEEAYSQLANALCLLCGACPQEAVLAEKLADESVDWIPATLSMMPFVYDALLKADRSRYARLILDRLDRVYLEMLRSGATSFWETELGAADFNDAGSLCHGWSASPVYYYQILREYL